MSDPARQPPRASSTQPAEHQAVIEHLLLSGLDHYFAGQYERAIQVWTRVFFLDRAHARARAYIERARNAIAERQRESDELLAGGLSALHAGDAQRARDLLTSAVDRGGPEVEALTALDRLNRLTALEAVGVDPGQPTPSRVSPPSTGGMVPQAILIGMAVVLLGIAAWLVLDWNRVSAWWQGTADAGATSVVVEPLPLPDPSAVTLERARALYERGALDEALRALSSIPAADVRSAEAATLRADVQRRILRSIPSRPKPRPVSPDRRNVQR